MGDCMNNIINKSDFQSVSVQISGMERREKIIAGLEICVRERMEEPKRGAITTSAQIIELGLPQWIRAEMIPAIFTRHRQKSNFIPRTSDIIECAKEIAEEEFQRRKEDSARKNMMNIVHHDCEYCIIVAYRLLEWSKDGAAKEAMKSLLETIPLSNWGKRMLEGPITQQERDCAAHLPSIKGTVYELA